ncbi:MAG TPA: hypothetical protein VK019_01445 [Pseudomonas sp.]|nr:hypothetical protein [Pseudomonas sp.]
MPAFLLLFLAFACLPAEATPHDQLFKAAGWPQQREHFQAALHQAQQRYRDSLPAGVYQALVNNSNQRFQPRAMDERALAALRARLADPAPALAFFQSPLGRKVVAAEVGASSPASLNRPPPKATPSDARRALLQRLTQALPAGEASVEVSLALAGVAADSLSQMLPGLPLGMLGQGTLNGQRERLRAQVEPRLLDGLAQVYRSLGDDELERFVRFAESADGQRYYQAALAALRAALRARE